MDPRMAIAYTQDLLDKAKISTDDLWKELNSCKGPEDAIKICRKWAKLAEKAVAS